MKRIISVFILSLLSGGSVLAQSATAVGVGAARSTSISASRATAISGQGGTGIGTGGNPTASVTLQGNPAVTTQNVNNTGTQTIRNVPTEFAPGLTAAGLETCLGSISGGGAFVGTGFSFGSTIPDPGCAARLDARTLWSFGLKKAAIARLCLGDDVYRAMPEVCAAYLPRPAAVPVSGYYLSAGESYKGGPIMLIEGRTGQDRLCNDYDATKQRCRVWFGAVSHHSKPKKVAAAVGVITSPAASPPPASIATSENQEGNSK